MGRPINSIYIDANGSTAGGEGVASLTVNGANSYSAGTTISFAASPIGGTTAAASITFVTPAAGAPGNGNVASYSITTAGTGYTSAPAVTFNKPANVVVDGFTAIYGNVVKFSTNVTSGIYAGMVANVFFTAAHLGNPTRVVAVDTTTGNITFSMANTASITSPISFGDVGRLGSITAVLNPAVTTGNTIQANAWTTNSSMGLQADILRQKSTKKYRVANSTDTENCVLVANAAVVSAGGPLAAGQMTIQLTDSASGTYYAKKLFDRTVVVYPGTGTQFTEDQKVSWNMNAAVASTSLKIATND
jgi:hypothetical protein